MDVYSELYGVRDISAVFDALLEVLDPTNEGVAGGVAEDIAEEDWYAGGCIVTHKPLPLSLPLCNPLPLSLPLCKPLPLFLPLRKPLPLSLPLCKPLPFPLPL